MLTAINSVKVWQLREIILILMNSPSTKTSSGSWQTSSTKPLVTKLKNQKSSQISPFSSPINSDSLLQVASKTSLTTTKNQLKAQLLLSTSKKRLNLLETNLQNNLEIAKYQVIQETFLTHFLIANAIKQKKARQDSKECYSPCLKLHKNML